MQQSLAEKSRRYFYEIMNGARFRSMQELLAPDFMFTLPTHPEPFVGPKGFNDLVTMLHTAFPDFYINPQQSTREGNTVVTRWRGGGTHLADGPMTPRGMLPASHNSFEIDGITWHIFNEDGQIIRAIGYEDTLGMLMQLGVMAHRPIASLSPNAARNRVAKLYNDVLNDGNIDVADTLLHEDFSFHSPRLPEPIMLFRPFSHTVPLANFPPNPALFGAAAYKQYLHEMRTAFPDMHYEILHEVAEPNRVAVHWKLRGTQQGDYMGIASADRSFEILGITIYQFRDGKLHTVHENANEISRMQQLGILPE